MATTQIKAFVSKYGAEILQAIKGKQIYFPVVVGQLCYESGYGSSHTAIAYNNFGGVRNLSGKVPLATGTSPSPEKYAIYSKAEDYFKSHIAVITLQRYVDKGIYKADTPEAQLWAIADGGYCEDPASHKVYYEWINGIMQQVKRIYPLGKIV